ncbi:MAG: hypothetical protein MPJ22_00620 [Pirellulales bacterium]|nr:hypothetical protein [Alphaproteobacteria bacterium]MDA8030054.1 hypothetical protein [Alphaproteobacteria bacterium]MDA8040912.1 hypothetical protein [Pirellulales bacterium]
MLARTLRHFLPPLQILFITVWKVLGCADTNFPYKKLGGGGPGVGTLLDGTPTGCLKRAAGHQCLGGCDSCVCEASDILAEGISRPGIQIKFWKGVGVGRFKKELPECDFVFRYEALLGVDGDVGELACTEHC